MSARLSEEASAASGSGPAAAPPLARFAPDTGDARAALDHVRAVVAESGTSFRYGMLILPKPRRDAMYAVYAFCRTIDDVADEAGARADKRAALQAWRAAIDRLYDGRASDLVTRALLGPVARYDLPREEFLAVIDGMESDIDGPATAMPLDDLRLYCRRVAGAVGLLSIRIFGAREPEALDLAVALGEAMQFTNILRDLDEDAARGRLYLPAEDLAAAGVAGRRAETVLADPNLPAACASLARRARADFAEVDRLARLCRRSGIRPALVMMGAYEMTLDRLERRGWDRRDGGRLGKADKLRAAVVRGLLRRL
ncbi:MAG: presqualene diphosphate synthase HpnD [Azospirillaceae bacterium]